MSVCLLKGQVVSAKSPKLPCNNCGLRCLEKIDKNGRKYFVKNFGNLLTLINRETKFVDL